MSDVATESAVPHDMDGLRQLYFTEFCPLYNYLCSKLESIPSELHFEVSAAFDHLMRAGLEIDGRKYEAENIAKASGHLKRAALFRGLRFLAESRRVPSRSRAMIFGVMSRLLYHNRHPAVSGDTQPCASRRADVRPVSLRRGGCSLDLVRSGLRFLAQDNKPYSACHPRLVSLAAGRVSHTLANPHYLTRDTSLAFASLRTVDFGYAA